MRIQKIKCSLVSLGSREERFARPDSGFVNAIARHDFVQVPHGPLFSVKGKDAQICIGDLADPCGQSYQASPENNTRGMHRVTFKEVGQIIVRLQYRWLNQISLAFTAIAPWNYHPCRGAAHREVRICVHQPDLFLQFARISPVVVALQKCNVLPSAIAKHLLEVA